ncbi:MAG: hypothetical protein RR603_07515, partial [Kurthia sp.]
IVRGLKASTNESVAVAEDGGPQEPYPFTSIKITVLGRKIGQAAEYMKNAQLIHEKDIELVLSVSCVSNTLSLCRA